MDAYALDLAYHRQSRAVVCNKAVLKSGLVRRWYKEVGNGIKTPNQAIFGTYIDKKCPWTGDNIAIRGSVYRGVCISNNMNRTCIVRRNYLHYIQKYRRFEKRHSNIAVHVSPALEVTPGDVVTFGHCRPLSKTVTFNALAVQPVQSTVAPRKMFRIF